MGVVAAGAAIGAVMARRVLGAGSAAGPATGGRLLPPALGAARAAVILGVVASAAVAGIRLPGLDRPPTVLRDARALLPRLQGGSLPGRAVGVLEWDPAATPGSRIMLAVGDRTWPNLFVVDPRVDRPIDFPIGGGRALHLRHGVRPMRAADVPGRTLPALVSALIDRGRGVTGLNTLLVSVRPLRPPLPLGATAAACARDYRAGGAHVDRTYLSWDAAAGDFLVTVVRTSPSRVVHTHHLPHPLLMVPGRPVAAARYVIHASTRRVVRKEEGRIGGR